MTLDQLRIFIAVAQSLHVTRAAEELGISQSGASAAIAAFEARYALDLFHRVGRRIELTDAGKTFLPAAQAVLARVTEAQRDLAELSSLARGNLSIYTSQTVGTYWLPARLGEFRGLHPGIHLHIEIGSSRAAAAAVMRGSADLGVAECRIHEPALEQTELEGDKLVLLYAAGLPLAMRTSRRLSDFKDLPWIVRERGSETRRVFDEAWRRIDIDPAALNIVLELPSNEAVLTAVEFDLGSTLASNLLTKRTTLCWADIGLRTRQFIVLRHRERNVSRAQRAMLNILHRNNSQQATSGLPEKPVKVP